MKNLIIGLLLFGSVSVTAADFHYKVEGDVSSISKFILHNKVIDISKCSHMLICEGRTELFVTTDDINVFLAASSQEKIKLKITLTDEYAGKEAYNRSFNSIQDMRSTLSLGGKYSIKLNETFLWE